MLVTGVGEYDAINSDPNVLIVIVCVSSALGAQLPAPHLDQTLTASQARSTTTILLAQHSRQAPV